MAPELGWILDARDTSIKDTEHFDALPAMSLMYDSNVILGAAADFDTES